MRRVIAVAAVAVAAFGLWAGMHPAGAQSIPKSIEEGGTDAVMKNKRNAWTVGIVGGLMSGSYMRFVDELGKALDDGDDLRVLPIVSYGAASNLDDLLYLKGVDAAITQSDVFEYFTNERKIPNLKNRVHYVMRLPITEVHILARKEFKSLEDLRGKKVSFGPEGAGSSLTGPIIFQRLGIAVEGVNYNPADSMEKLKSGEIAALIRMVGKPIDYFSKMTPDSNMHFLPIPFTKQFADYYTLAEFTHEDYPSLVPQGQRVDTLGVPTVLAVFNWSKGGDRHRRVERFVERLFAHWEKFQKPPYHPKWRDVNLAATVPGWTRYFVVDDILKKAAAERPAPQAAAGARDQTMNRDFQAFLDTGNTAPRSEAEREKLFREFMTWRQRQGARSQ